MWGTNCYWIIKDKPRLYFKITISTNTPFKKEFHLWPWKKWEFLLKIWKQYKYYHLNQKLIISKVKFCDNWMSWCPKQDNIIRQVLLKKRIVCSEREQIFNWLIWRKQSWNLPHTIFIISIYINNHSNFLLTLWWHRKQTENAAVIEKSVCFNNYSI